MTLRESQNWHIDDHFPGVAIDAIPLVSEQLNSLYARTYQKVHLQRSFTKLAGVIFLAKDLEYHRNNFLHACHMAGVPSLHTVPDQTHTTYTEVAKFEAIAYINTVGTINTWIDNHRPRLVPAPKMLEITRSFRNWTHPSMQSWQTMASHYNLLPIHYQPPVSGKNATDIKLSIDAMDLCRDGYQRFCVVSSDSDFTPLVQRLGEHGCFVLGIGNINTPSLLQHACSTFLSTDQVLPPSRSKTSSALPVLPTTPPIAMPVVMQRNEPTEKQPTSTAPSQTLSSLHTILRETYLQIANDEGKEWVTLARFGQILRQRDPSFKVKSHGSSTLKALLVQQTDLFDIQKQVGNHLILRLKEQH